MSDSKPTPEQITQFCVLCRTGQHSRQAHIQDLIDDEPERCLCQCIGCLSGACQLCDLEHGVVHTEPISPIDQTAPGQVERHIFGAGGCWCGYNQTAYQAGGLNHPQAAAARDLLGAADRMRDRWAEGDDAVKRQLWRDLHTKADMLHHALEQQAAPEQVDQ